MNMQIAFCTLIVLLCIGASSCKNENKTNTGKDNTTIINTDDQLNDSLIITDTIIYELVIKNTNKADEWKEECLKHLDRREYVDYLFNSVYNGSIIPSSEETNQPLAIEDIERLEKDPEFNRDNIGMIQFHEKWIYNTTEKTFTKYVYAAILGYEVYDSEGGVIGYKPVFRVNFK